MIKRDLMFIFLFAFLMFSGCRESGIQSVNNVSISNNDFSNEVSGIIADSSFLDGEISTTWSKSGYIVFYWKKDMRKYIDSVYLHEPLEESYRMDHSFIISKLGNEIMRTDYKFLDSNYVITGVYDGSWNINYYVLSVVSDGLVIKPYDFFNDKGLLVKGNYFGLLTDPYYVHDTIRIIHMQLIEMTSKTGYYFNPAKMLTVSMAESKYPDFFYNTHDKTSYYIFDSIAVQSSSQNPTDN